MSKHRFPGDFAGVRDHRGNLKPTAPTHEFVEGASVPVEEVTPPVDADGLRLDGPTLAEFVAAGYSAENYPPEGYAAKPDAE